MNLNRPAFWTRISLVSLALWPVSLLFQLMSVLRRLAFRSGLKSSWRSPVPVIIVGNITVGGAGKTPLVIALAEVLTREGYEVGIVTRGYGGMHTDQRNHAAITVSADSDPSIAGDEPVLIARRTGLPVVVSRSRVSAAQHLLEKQQIDCILCDDGLQHYALQRDLEIAVVDPAYLFGNGFCLPAGPLREPVSRLNTVDYTVYSGKSGGKSSVQAVSPSKTQHCQSEVYSYQLTGDELVSLADESNRLQLSCLSDQSVHAVAGIAAPEKFFEYLHKRGIATINHRFPDHSSYHTSDFVFDDQLPVIMTEKDSVKCRGFGLQNAWCLPVIAQLDDSFESDLLSRVAQIIAERKTHAN